ncbi:MAG: hypothetical protein JXA77_04385 [Bacteroidales bacterium]|nr:hypothetical protein [Bacteroidales bacterium]MBN2819792.1 hypothetical protein [Bacteroidales bacterium]
MAADICIPIKDFGKDKQINIVIEYPNSEKNDVFKLEVFSCKDGAENKKKAEDVVFNKLKFQIDNYDRNWEVVQVSPPQGEENNIVVLFRKR